MRFSSSSSFASSDDWEITPPLGAADAQTLVLVGKTGNGKSATGNTIIGRKVFDSKASFGGVTSSCQLETTVLDDGRILNVIDTPGLFDSRVEGHVMATEIARCINMAKDGIHALVLVVSLRNRFSEEEASAFESLLEIFGGEIADYMIVVFTHGDVLEDDMCLDDLLGPNCPPLLMSTLEICGRRTVVFDNKTGDKVKMQNELVSLVDYVVDSNGGKPYTNDLFVEAKRKEANQIDQKLPGLNEEQFERLIEMVESRLKESIANLEKQLAEERAARMEAEAKVQEAETQTNWELEEMKGRLRRAEEMCKPHIVMGNMINGMAHNVGKSMRDLHEKIHQKQKELPINDVVNNVGKCVRDLHEKIHQKQKELPINDVVNNVGKCVRDLPEKIHQKQKELLHSASLFFNSH